VNALAAQDFSYGKILKVFREASKDENLKARLVIDAVPKHNREYEAEGAEQYTSEDQSESFNSGSGNSNDSDKIHRVNTELIAPEPVEEGISSRFEKLKGLFSGKKSY